MNKILGTTCALLLSGLAQAAVADQVVVHSSNLGWYSSAGTHQASNVNTLTGFLGQEYRSFYEWTLPSFAGTVTGAYLEMALPYSLGVSQGTQLGSIFDVSSQSLATIELENGAGNGLSIFGDLGSGSAYGGFTISEANNLSTFRINLNAAAVNDINGVHGGTFALGMRNTTPGNTNSYFLFSSGGQRGDQTLVLDVIAPVPEPTTWALLAAGLGFVAWSARRRSQA